jgi:hypothetical protein
MNWVLVNIRLKGILKDINVLRSWGVCLKVIISLL